MSETFTVAFVALEIAWPALLVLIFLSSLGFSRAGRFPPLRSFMFLYLPFLILCLWGGLNWATLQDWRTTVLDILAVFSALLIVGIPWWFRRSPRWWVLLPASLASLVLAAGAWFTAGMAIWDSWL